VKNWIIISPNGVTLGPDAYEYENFQVLGLVDAEAETDILEQLKNENPYLIESGYKEVWIYQLLSKTPIITNLVPEKKYEPFNNQKEKELVYRISGKLLELNAFSDIRFDFADGSSFFFEGYSDALQEIRVDLNENILRVYDRYIAEKHIVHFGDILII
jgi:hypothetical protein